MRGVGGGFEKGFSLFTCGVVLFVTWHGSRFVGLGVGLNFGRSLGFGML